MVVIATMPKKCTAGEEMVPGTLKGDEVSFSTAEVKNRRF